MVSSKDVSYLDRFLWCANTLFHQVLAVVTIYIFWQILSVYKWNSHFTLHLVLSTFAYIPLMAEAIILFSSDNVWTQYMDRTRKYILHAVLLTISFVLATVGIFIETYDKNQAKRPHFTTIHAQTGIASWFLMVLALLPGIFGWTSFKVGPIKPVLFKFIHNCSGVFGYVLGMVSLWYGLNGRSFRMLSSQDSLTALTIAISLVTAWSLIGSFKSGYNQLKAIFSSS